MNTAARTALEAIAFGDDAELRPGDRLRALELLEEAGDLESVPAFMAEVLDVPAEELDAELDMLLSRLIADEALAIRFPRLAASIAQAVEERARQLADAKRIDAKVERRSRELARETYESRAFEVVEPEPAQPPRALTR